MKKLLAALLLILCAGPSSAQVAPVAYNATTALANGLVVKNVGPGRMFGFQALNNNAAVRFILVYDAAAAPADGTTTPTMWYALAGSASAPNNSITVSLGLSPVLFLNGIVFVCSSTGPFTKTAAADCAIAVQAQ